MKKALGLSAILLSLTASGCGLFYHKEVIHVPEPARLTEDQVMEQARGAKLVYTEKTTGERVSGTLRAAQDDTSLVLINGKERSVVSVNNVESADLELSASKLSFTGCLITGCLSALGGMGLGAAMANSVYNDINDDNDEDQSCAGALVAPIVMALALILAAFFGLITALVVGGIILLLGGVVLPNIFLNEKVKNIKARAKKLRQMLSGS